MPNKVRILETFSQTYAIPRRLLSYYLGPITDANVSSRDSDFFPSLEIQDSSFSPRHGRPTISPRQPHRS